MNIQIDKNPPTYNINDPIGSITQVSHKNNEYVIDFGDDNTSTVNVTVNIKEILDTLSGIEGIQYSLEKQGNPEKYYSLSIDSNNNTTFTKTLDRGTWILKVDVRDNSGNKTIKTIKYHMYQKVTRPTNSYCKTNVIYNDATQTYVNDAPTGVTFTNISGINAGDYTVTASLKDYYSWSSGERLNNQTFVCTILRRDTTCTSASDSKTYDGNALTKGGGSCTNLVSGHSPTFTNTGSRIDVGSSNNTISSVVIKNSGGTNVTSNYNVTTATGTLTVNKRDTTCTSASDSKTYDGNALTKGGGSCTNLVSGHSSTFSNSESRTDAGSSNNTISSVVITNSGGGNVSGNYNITPVPGTLTINKRDTTCTSSSASKTYDGNPLTKGGGSCTNLVSGHYSSFSNSGSRTDVGSSNNTISSVAIYNSGGGNVSGNYNISTATGTLTVSAATPTLSLSPASGTLTYGSNGTSTISTNSGGSLSCASSNASVATCSISGKTLTITPKALSSDGGTATITVTLGAAGNYTSKTTTYSVTVNRKALSCPSSKYYTYTGSNIGSGITCPTNSTSGGTTIASGAGEYTQTCSASSGYVFSGGCSVNWKIVVACNGACNSYSTNFTSIQNAVDNTSSGTIYILANHTFNSSVSVYDGKNIVLDMNGKTITSTAAGFHISGTNTRVTFKNGTLNVAGDFVGAIRNTSSAIIESGTYTGKNGFFSYPGESGNITITGGTITGVDQAVEFQSGGTLTITGGNLTGGAAGVRVTHNGTANITGGTITGNKYDAIAFQKATDEQTVPVTSGGSISGVKLTGKNYCVYSTSSGSISINTSSINCSAGIKKYCRISGGSCHSF